MSVIKFGQDLILLAHFLIKFFPPLIDCAFGAIKRPAGVVDGSSCHLFRKIIKQTTDCLLKEKPGKYVD